MTTDIARLPLADVKDIAQVRQRIKELGEEAGLGIRDQAAFATAVSEIARNAVQHGGGGEVHVYVTSTAAANRLDVVVQDHGNGIADVKALLANPGAGEGLIHARRFSDHFVFESPGSPGGGTRVTLGKDLPPATSIAGATVERWREVLLRDQAVPSMMDLLRAQNQELSDAFLQLQKRESELEKNLDQIRALNLELEETNNGLIAIHKELNEKSADLEAARVAAEAATEAKATFLANMSHEIRTPMNAVIGMTELLRYTQLDEQQRDMVETIHGSGTHLLTVISDILDFSKIESGKLELEEQPFDIRACVEETLALMAAKAVEKGIELVYLHDPGAPESLVGDAGRVRQILANYLGNAIKFTASGEVNVRVGAQARDDKRWEIHFAVHDTGMGIPADRLDRLFKSFSQVEASTTRAYGGTGLGLAISKRLAELMGGRVWVDSEPGTGSTFHFTIVGAAALALPTNPTPTGDLRELRLLVVDDNETNRRMLRGAALSWGMTVQDTEFPRQALEWLDAGKVFDVAVLDYLMPEMNGAELAAEIRKRRDAGELSLIIASSLGATPRAAVGVVAAQLSKPIRLAALHDTMQRVISQREGAQPLRAPGKPRTPVSSQHLRILVAEDNPTNQRVALMQLQALGHHADVVQDGAAAVAAVENNSYDVVLMDVQMPVLDGLAATRAICARWGPAERPRIIAMTANALSGDRALCLAAGMDDYMAKPLTTDTLATALAAVSPAHGVHRGPGKVGHAASSAAHQPGVNATADPEPDLAARWPLRLLVADDNLVNQKLAQAQFRQLGYRVDLAATGNQAIEAIAARTYDAVFMDVHMPDLDGLEATRLICARWPAGQRPRIIGMTADAGPEDRKRCLDAGMDDCIPKPVALTDLGAILRNCQPR